MCELSSRDHWGLSNYFDRNSITVHVPNMLLVHAVKQRNVYDTEFMRTRMSTVHLLACYNQIISHRPDSLRRGRVARGP